MFIILILLLAIIATLLQYDQRDPRLPVYDYTLEKVDGDYVITLTPDREEGWSVLINYCKYEYHDENGRLVEEGRMETIWQKNPDFLDSNSSKLDHSIFLFIHSGSDHIDNGSMIIIRSSENGGIGSRNGSLSLLYWFQPYELFLNVTLRDNVITDNISYPQPPDHTKPTFRYIDTADHINDSLQISTDHLSSDSYYQYPSTECPIGLTILNNATEHITNVSINVSWDNEIVKDPQNYTKQKFLGRIESHERVRIVWYFSVPGLRGFWGDIDITAEIHADGMTEPIIVGTTIWISSISLT